MKKYFFIAFATLALSQFLFAQTEKTKYPEPEFSNEVYYLKKGDAASLVRLEKNASKLETKAKLAGMGGVENGYIMDEEKSPVRLSSGKDLSFIFSTGSSAKSSPEADSVMRANGMDPSMMSGMDGMNDPSTMITLYKAASSKGSRKIYLMKSGGAFSMGKNKSSDKYTTSVRKIRERYWELIVDKPLPKGEYAFSVMGMSYDGSATLFAFGID